MTTLLEVKKLTKLYTPQTGAADISFEIKSGEVLGFIGPNGAGKTTTIKMIMGLINPDKGEFTFKAKRINTLSEFAAIYKDIGFCPSSPAVFDELTALEMFRLKAAMHSDSDITNQGKDYAEQLDLVLSKKIRDLSMGNRQKVSFILSIIGNPKILIMDEPTSGMDPLIRIKSMEILNKLSQKGTGILLSSHNLTEIEAICDKVIIIKKSKIIYNGTIEEIKKKFEKKIKFKVKDDEELNKIIDRITVSNISKYDHSIELITPDTNKVIKWLIDNKIEDFTVERPSLEEAFIDYYKPNE